MVGGFAYSVTSGTPAIDAASTPDVWTDGRVRVEVLNAGGVTGMARSATRIVRQAGFDVVDFGNALTAAGNFDTERPSVVIDRVGRTDFAQAVAASLGIDNVQSDPDPNLFVDVSVVLGREWIDPRERAATDEASTTRSVWDPRRWFVR